MRPEGGRWVHSVTVGTEPWSSHEDREEGEWEILLLLQWGNCTLKKERVWGSRNHSLTLIRFQRYKCKGAGENSGLELCTRNRSGSVAYLHASQPQGITYWKVWSKTRNETSLYKCIPTYIGYVYGHGGFVHWHSSKCLSQKTLCFFVLSPLFFPSASPHPSSFIFSLSISLHFTVVAGALIDHRLQSILLGCRGSF